MSHAKPKPTYWVSMQRWMGLTLEQHRNLESYCRTMGYELGIDIAGYHTDALGLRAEFQADKDDEAAGDWTR